MQLFGIDARVPERVTFVSLVSLATAACSNQPAQIAANDGPNAAANGRCVQSRLATPFNEAATMHSLGSPQFYEVEVRADGSLFWNLRPATLAQVREYLGYMRSMGTPAVLERVRSAIAKPANNSDG
jgi:hypothetical protein